MFQEIENGLPREFGISIKVGSVFQSTGPGKDTGYWVGAGWVTLKYGINFNVVNRIILAPM